MVGLVRSGIQKIIRFLKKDNNYTLNSEYTLGQLFIIVLNRFIQALRGLVFKMLFKKSRGLIFRGKGVKVIHKNLVSVGRNFIIEDGSFINALSINGIEFGENVTIGRNSTIICTGVIKKKGIGIKIGNNTGINAHAYIGGQGGIYIGNNVIIGPYVKIFSENHIFDDLHRPIKEQGESRKGVIIKDNCWIGAGVTILDGVIIESGVVVAAGSVVTKNVASYTIIGGIPAKLIKIRT